MCEHCEVASAETEALLAEVEGDSELEAYFCPGEHAGWLRFDTAISDRVLAHLEKMVAVIERWALAKGESAEHHVAGCALPVPLTAQLAIMRELQLRRSLERMEETSLETFKL